MNMVATRARVAGSRAAAAFLALAIALVVGLVPHLALAQNRVTDHRLHGEVRSFNIEAVMNGDLDPIIDALTAQQQAEQLEKQAETL